MKPPTEQLKTLPRGTILLAPGQKVPGIYNLHSGSIRQFLISPKGNELTIHIFFPGSFFPAISMFEILENRYYYEALRTSSISIIKPLDLKKYFKENSDELFAILQRILKGVEGLSRRIEATTFGDSAIRTISVLLYLAKHFGKKTGKKIEISHKFTHQQISTFIGVSRERTSIELAKLQKENLINYKTGIITINSVSKMERILSSKI